MGTRKRIVRIALIPALAVFGTAAPALAGTPGSAPTTAAASAALKLGPQSTPEQLLALPAAAMVETETGKQMTAAKAKKAMKAREKRLAKLKKKKKPPRKKGPVVESPKQLAPAPLVAATTIMARPTASASPGIGAAEAYSACGMSATKQRYFSSVNGASAGAAFTPDSVYKLAGCGFGAKKGTVALTGGSAGGMFNVSLPIESWANDAISVRVDPKLSGVTDQANVVLVVTLSDGSSLQQGGHSFVAATEEVALPSVPPGWLVSSSLRQPATVKSPGPSGATLEVWNLFQPSTQFCPREVTTDVLRLSQLALKQGFAVDRVELRNLVPQDLAPGGDPEPSLYNTLSYGWNGDDFQVSPQWLQQYAPKDLFLGGYSFCSTNYELTVFVRGPRGFSPQ